MRARSARPEVRNPVLRLPSTKRLIAFLDRHPDLKSELIGHLVDVRRDALEAAEKAWDTHKAASAVYWKATGVKAGHLVRAIK